MLAIGTFPFLARKGKFLFNFVDKLEKDKEKVQGERSVNREEF